MAKTVIGWIRRLAGRNEYDCNDIVENCSEYVDEEMTVDETVRFEKHMNDCPECGSFVRTFRATVMTARDLPFRAANANLKQRIRDRIAASRS